MLVLALCALLGSSLAENWAAEVDFGVNWEAPDFSYEGDTGPAFWQNLHPSFSTCGTGTQQSPINLMNYRINGMPADLSIHWTALKSPITVANNGYYFQVAVASNSEASKNYVTYQGKVYQFQQFHFHGYEK